VKQKEKRDEDEVKKGAGERRKWRERTYLNPQASKNCTGKEGRERLGSVQRTRVNSSQEERRDERTHDCIHSLPPHIQPPQPIKTLPNPLHIFKRPSSIVRLHQRTQQPRTSHRFLRPLRLSKRSLHLLRPLQKQLLQPFHVVRYPRRRKTARVPKRLSGRDEAL